MFAEVEDQPHRPVAGRASPVQSANPSVDRGGDGYDLARGAQSEDRGAPAHGQVDFSASVETIKAAAGDLLAALTSIAVTPSACEISFGVKLSGSVGAILAKATAEANFTVKMSWTDLDQRRP